MIFILFGIFYYYLASSFRESYPFFTGSAPFIKLYGYDWRGTNTGNTLRKILYKILYISFSKLVIIAATGRGSTGTILALPYL